MRSQRLQVLKNKRHSICDTNEKREFKEGKVCERCGTKGGKGRPNQLTIHNHKLPKKFWMVFCRKCHDMIEGIERNAKNEIVKWYHNTDKENWHNEEQGWYEQGVA